MRQNDEAETEWWVEQRKHAWEERRERRGRGEEKGEKEGIGEIGERERREREETEREGEKDRNAWNVCEKFP